MSIPGEKASLVNLMDNSLALETELTSLTKIEVLFAKSPKKGVLCGSLVVFRNNTFDGGELNPFLDKRDQKTIQEHANKQTEVMAIDPIHFRETDGQWISWAMTKALELYDRYGSADVIVKCPKLKIKCKRSSREVAAGRSDVDALFPVLRDIDRLLRMGYTWDPWNTAVRRGLVNAEMGKR